jgi:hypothetical protein
VNDAEYGSRIDDQRNVHRELTVAAEKLPRAVERVDQPESATGYIRQTAFRGCLLGDQRDLRGKFGKTRLDDRLRGDVGDRDR